MSILAHFITSHHDRCIKTRMQLQTKPQSIASSSSTVGSPLPSITRSPQQQMRHTGKRLKTAAHGRHATSAVTATTSLFTPRIPIIDNRSSAQSPAIHQTLHRSKVSAAVSYSTAATAVAVSSRTTALPSTAATVPSIRQPPTEMYYKNSLDCARQILRQEGARGLFRGLGASYLGVIETGCQWVVYERMKKSVREYHDAKNAASSTTTTSASTKPGILLDYLLVSAVAKTVATLLSYPHEVLRTRLRQTVTTTSASDSAVTVVRPRYAGMRDVVRTVWRQEGARAFYGGLTAHLFRTVPNAAIMFFCYESVVFLADVVQ